MAHCQAPGGWQTSSFRKTATTLKQTTFAAAKNKGKAKGKKSKKKRNDSDEDDDSPSVLLARHTRISQLLALYAAQLKGAVRGGKFERK